MRPLPAATIVSLLSLACAASAQDAMFDQLDRNRDGSITTDEIPPETRALLPLIDANGDGALSRQEFAGLKSALDALIPHDAGEAVGDNNLNYADGSNPRQTLDLYYPEDRSKPLPLVVYIHGGGWVAGSKREGERFAKLLTATGHYAVASINYRLIQDAPWPAQIHDCKAAIRYLRGHAGRLGIDPKRIAVMGSSAGGHLALLLGTTAGEPKLEGELGRFPQQPANVSAVVNFFGPTRFETFFGKDVDPLPALRGSVIGRMLGGDDQTILANAREASPVQWVSSGDAPVLTAHGTADQVVPYSQARELHESLETAGVPHHLVTMQGGGHGFNHPELQRRILLFLDQHLRGKTAEIPADPILLR